MFDRVMKMRIIESRVRSCIEEHVIIDKKMRERRFKYKRYNIPLNDDQPFQEDEAVKIISSNDFLTIQRMVKELRDDKKALKTHIETLNKSLEEKDNQIKISNNENSQNKNIKNKLIKQINKILG
jgi:hypothetical protein